MVGPAPLRSVAGSSHARCRLNWRRLPAATSSLPRTHDVVRPPDRRWHLPLALHAFACLREVGASLRLRQAGAPKPSKHPPRCQCLCGAVSMVLVAFGALILIASSETFGPL